MSRASRPRVAIVGAGFGGLNAAKALAGKPVEVLLLDRHNYHLFQPLLYQVATAGLEPEEIAYPVRRVLARAPNVEFRLAAVERVELERRRLVTDVGEIEYDYLILAGGSDNNFFGLDELARHVNSLKSLGQAEALRNHVLTCLEHAAALPPSPERTAALTFVIGGGGPTGVELAGALAELVQLVAGSDYPTIPRRDVRLLLVEGGADLVSMVRPRLRRAVLRELHRRGVEVKLHSQVKTYDGHTVTLSDGSAIAAEMLAWAAGVRAADLAGAAGLEQGRAGRIRVGPTLQAPGHGEVYVIGDMAYLEQGGSPLPQLAPVAIQQAHAAVANILRDLAGEAPRRFHYRDKGTLATIGRKAAVAQFGPLGLSGTIAWFMWLTVHIVLLIGFRNRLLVLLNWAWNYFRFERAVRLITAPDPRLP